MAEVADSSFAARLAELHAAAIKKAIRTELRVPDCGHTHVSWPEADVETILRGLERAGFSVMPTDAILALVEDDIDKWEPVFPKIVAALEALND